MSVIFGVIPFDSTIPEFVEWLEEKDITVPDEHGRYPTFDEVVRTLETFGEFPVYKEQVTGNLWEVAILYQEKVQNSFSRIVQANQVN